MPRLPKRCIESLDQAIRGTDIILDCLQLAKEFSKTSDERHIESYEKLYELNVDASMDMMIAVIPWILSSAANGEHLKKLCDTLIELGEVIAEKKA